MNRKISKRRFLAGAAMSLFAVCLLLNFGVPGANAFYQSPILQKWQTNLRGVTGSEGIPVAAPDGTAPVTKVKHYTINIQEFVDQLYPNIRGYF